MFLIDRAGLASLFAHALLLWLMPAAPAQAQAAQVTRSLGGALAWPGLLRKLDRLDTSYRD